LTEGAGKVQHHFLAFTPAEKIYLWHVLQGLSGHESNLGSPKYYMDLRGGLLGKSGPKSYLFYILLIDGKPQGERGMAVEGLSQKLRLERSVSEIAQDLPVKFMVLQMGQNSSFR
jgi:hypothetical protein